MAVTAVTQRGISVALACRTFGLSETCYRYTRKLDDENAAIADLLVGLTLARRTWGFGLCFLYLGSLHESALIVRHLGRSVNTHRICRAQSIKMG